MSLLNIEELDLIALKCENDPCDYIFRYKAKYECHCGCESGAWMQCPKCNHLQFLYDD